MGISLKRLIVNVLLLLVVCLSTTFPLASADRDQSHVLNSGFWTVYYTISDVSVVPGQVLALNVNFTGKVTVYDFRFQVVSNPASLVTGSVWTFPEILPDLMQRHTFFITISTSAATGTQYEIDLQLQGYNDTARFPFLSWDWIGFHAYRGFFFWMESPEYTQTTNATLGQSIVLTVTSQ